MQNIIFILLTDRPYFFAVLPIDQKINLVSSKRINRLLFTPKSEIEVN